jgi:tryptophanyl-tRNA synthetase
MPEATVQKDTMLIPGTDGLKMSKSRENTINIFLPQKQLKKQVMSIETDSTPLEEPKNPDTCNVFALYELLATPAETKAMRAKYLGGNFGFGHAKLGLLECILEKYEAPRERYNYYMNNLKELDAALTVGAEKAASVADTVLQRVREKLGY